MRNYWALGNALDALPEAIVLGIALRGRVVPLALLIAFSMGNLPEALSSAGGMRAARRSYTYIFVLWSAIAIGAAVAIAAGYVAFGFDNVVRVIIDTYRAPNKTFSDDTRFCSPSESNGSLNLERRSVYPLRMNRLGDAKKPSPINADE